MPFYDPLGSEFLSSLGTPLPCSSIGDPPSITTRNGLIDRKYRWTNFSLYLDDTYGM